MRDLCARLPYGVRVRLNLPERMGNGYTLTGVDVERGTVSARLGEMMFREISVETLRGEQTVRPYLRPMSDMTEEERDDLCGSCGWIGFADHTVVTNGDDRCYEWLDAHYFDFRGLIPMGLASEAPEGMYKNK